MSLLVVGLNYRTAPVPLLERAAVPTADLAGVLADLLSGQYVTEAVVLSTCNRVEVYAAVTGFHGALNEVGEWLSARTGLHLGPLADHLYIQYAEDAVRHLFTVAAGLDSMVVGEAQILGQLRDAYNSAQQHGGPASLLHELMQQALRVGKRVHTDTPIDRAGQSMVSAALRIAEERTGPVAGRPVLVAGAGSMGALAAATLNRAGATPITIVNRTQAKAERIAATIGGRPGSFEDLPALLAEADFVVSVTGATGQVITAEDVSAAQQARGGRPMAILDLAVPRDTEPAVASIPGVTLIGIEQLAAALAGQPATAGVEAAKGIVDDEVDAFMSWQRAIDVAPTVAALRARADEVVETELAKLAPAARADAERTVRRVVSTLLHLPTVRMKELAAAPGGDWYATAVRDLFGLDVEGATAAEVVAVTTDPEAAR
ncbi:MAG: glutamyl-tRNA reductase [Cryptosporangiaceae bacterium]|nr:glutamyl-tRNA reductase [Cryptosporangiaceae bacterium]